MEAESRTAKSIKNSTIALIFYFIELVLKFFSRKIFLDYLGTEILGLNTTATNILQFLNLAELGIGSAIAFTLYKPLFEKDTDTVNEIVSLQGWMYRKIAWAVIGLSAVVMAFFPFIFEKMELPLWYAYASFGVLLVSALLSYFVNYKQIVLSADQKEYKIQYSYKAALLLKLLFQVAAMYVFDNGYLWWLILEVVFAVIASVALEITVKKTYPYLKTDLSRGRELSRKYPNILVKVKQLFFHKIGGFALTQSSPIIIYAYASLALVTLYGNYMMIILGVTNMMRAFFNSVGAGVGNLVAEGEKSKILSVFEELFSFRFWISAIVCFGVYILTPGFVTLWIGAEYVMDESVLILMTAALYINITRTTVDAYVNAYGLFSDIWAPVAEALINIGMSVILGYFFGLNGILAGVLISLFLMIFCWKPYFLFKMGFRLNIGKYVKIYLSNLIPSAVIFILYYRFYYLLPDISITSWSGFIFTGMIHVCIFSIFLFVGIYLTSRGMRDFISRFAKKIKAQ